MKYDIIEIKELRVIGIAKELKMSEGPVECPKFWNEFVTRFITPMKSGLPLTPQQEAIQKNMIGEFGLCICNDANGTFQYVIGGRHLGGEVPEGFDLYDLPDGRWLKFHFEGGMEEFHRQYSEVYSKFLPEHPEFKVRFDWNAEWYSGMDMSSPDYRCGLMIPLI